MAVAVVLVVAAFVVPHLHLGIVTPLINATPQRFHDFADTAPIFGWWNNHVGWGTVPAILIGAAAVLWGPTVAQRLPWRGLTLATLDDVMRVGVLAGDDRRLAARLRAAGSPPATSTCARCRPSPTSPRRSAAFARRILDYQPDSWITHVSGHPPGALLTFVWLDRIGLERRRVGRPAVPSGRLQRGGGDRRRGARVGRREHRTTGRTVRRGGADGHLDSGVRRRLFRGVAAWGIALLALAVRRTARGPMLAAAGCRSAAGLGDLPQLRPGAHGAAGSCGAVRRR